MQSSVQVFAGSKYAAGGEEKLTENSYEHKDNNGHDILGKQRRINEHTDGDEKDRAEKIFNRCDEFFNSLCLRRFGDERSHDERAEGGGEAKLGSDNDHAEAQADRDNDDGFIIHKLACPFEETGDKVHAEYEPEHEEENESCNAHDEFHGADAAAGDGERGEQHHHRDTGDVFHNEHTEDRFCEVGVTQF